MALVESAHLDRGTPLPQFSLQDPWNKTHSSETFCGKKGALVIFTCNHCPYAIALWPRLIAFSKKIKTMDISTVAINSNINPDYPEDSPQNMKKKIAQWEIPFPYLIDKSQDVARKFQAQCTPDIYLFDADGLLFYHGRFDDNWKDEKAVSQHDLEEAVSSLLAKKTLRQKIYPSMGCSIKWNS